MDDIGRFLSKGNDCSNLAMERSFLMHLSQSRTIINVSEPIWEDIGVGQISSLDQKVMYIEGESQRIDMGGRELT